MLQKGFKTYELPHIKVPRCLVPSGERGSFSLHVFTDAPERAYGAVIYTKYIQTNGEITYNIVLSKSGVAPLELTSIPRLELCCSWAEFSKISCKRLEGGHEESHLLDRQTRSTFSRKIWLRQIQPCR